MVSKKTITKIINKIITKNYTLKTSDYEKYIYQQINEITSNTDERRILKKEIWDFHIRIKKLNSRYEKEHGKKYPFEVLRCQSNPENDLEKRKTFENFRNQEKGDVDLPLGGKYYGCSKGLLFSMHYHPNDEVKINYKDEKYTEKLKFSCFQSTGDIDSMLLYNIKYNITFGHDGIMVIKNENYDNPNNYLNPNDYDGTFKEKVKQMVNDRFKVESNKNKKSDTHIQYKELDSKMNDDYDDVFFEYDKNNSLDKVPYGSDEYEALDNGFFNHYVSDNIEDYLKDMDNINGIKINYIKKI